MHWRSNKQLKSALSPAEAEVYALSTGVKDSLLWSYRKEELGIKVEWPIKIGIDNTSAYSFQRDAAPSTKMGGCFDLRDEWIQEMRNLEKVYTYKVDSEDNIADIHTKCLKPYKFREARDKIIRRMTHNFLGSN